MWLVFFNYAFDRCDTRDGGDDRAKRRPTFLTDDRQRQYNINNTDKKKSVYRSVSPWDLLGLHGGSIYILYCCKCCVAGLSFHRGRRIGIHTRITRYSNITDIHIIPV